MAQKENMAPEAPQPDAAASLRLLKKKYPSRVLTTDSPTSPPSGLANSADDRPIRPMPGADSSRPFSDERPIRPAVDDRPIRPATDDRPIRPAADDRPIRPATDDRPIRPATDDRPIRPAADRAGGDERPIRGEERPIRPAQERQPPRPVERSPASKSGSPANRPQPSSLAGVRSSSPRTEPRSTGPSRGVQAVKKRQPSPAPARVEAPAPAVAPTSPESDGEDDPSGDLWVLTDNNLLVCGEIAEGGGDVLIESKGDEKGIVQFILADVAFGGALKEGGGVSDSGRGEYCLRLSNLRGFRVKEADRADRGDKGFGYLPLENGKQLRGRRQVREFLDGDGRVDVILRPVREEEIWFPYWEGARKFAPYFRSAGVGYLRLGDDMGKHGLAFLSTDGGRTFVANDGFDDRRKSMGAGDDELSIDQIAAQVMDQSQSWSTRTAALQRLSGGPSTVVAPVLEDLFNGKPEPNINALLEAFEVLKAFDASAGPQNTCRRVFSGAVRFLAHANGRIQARASDALYTLVESRSCSLAGDEGLGLAAALEAPLLAGGKGVGRVARWITRALGAEEGCAMGGPNGERCAVALGKALAAVQDAATRQDLVAACQQLLAMQPETKPKLLAAAKQAPGSRLDAVLSGATAARTGSARSGTREKPASARERPAASAPAAAPQSGDFDTVSNGWFLVQMLLRYPVHSEADLQYVQQASVAADRYLNDIREMAPKVGMRRGQLSKAVLPYGETTSTLDQTHEENEPETQVLLDAGLNERQIAHLVRDATTLRKLVRVKIADDQDLDQAESAMHELKTFLAGLTSLSQSQQQSEWELLQQMK